MNYSKEKWKLDLPVTVYDCAVAADDSYVVQPSQGEKGWTIRNPRDWGAGFAASTFQRQTATIIGFRGTVDKEDALADTEMLPNVGVKASQGAIATLLSKYDISSDQRPDWLPEVIVGAVQMLRIYGHVSGRTDRVPHAQRESALAYFDATTPRPQFVTGHSLGGALAQIVALERQVPAVTFNSPMIGGLTGDVPVSSTLVLQVNAEMDPVSLLTQAAGSLPHGRILIVREPPPANSPPKGSAVSSGWFAMSMGAISANAHATYVASLLAYLERVAVYYHSMATLRKTLKTLDWATNTPINPGFTRIAA